MTDQDHPFKNEAWVTEIGPQEYYVRRQRGNWLILAGLVVFIGFTVAVTIWKWDSNEFMQVTNEHEAEQQRLDALREQQLKLREAEALDANS